MEKTNKITDVFVLKQETRAAKRIGNILLESGKLTPEDIVRISALQKENGLLFGEAAATLGILSEAEVSGALASQYSYPVLAPESDAVSNELVALSDPSSRQAETFRSIRSALILSGAGKLFKSIAIVSPDRGDGRTLIASNLAVAFAQLGTSTLLVDLNFRTPRIHEVFGTENHCGVSSLIIRRAAEGQAIQSTAIATLDILPSGPTPPNPVELLSWPATRELLTSLHQEYDVMIIDTPSFHKTSEAALIASLADVVILLAVKGKTKREAFGKVKKRLDQSSARVVGAILNETNGK